MRYLFVFALLFIPSLSHGALMLSEVAWMGSAVSANDEWIELYNHDATSVSVNGWTLSDGGGLSISLSGSVPARSFAVLERTDDDSAPGVSAFLIYTGALANTGGTLTLRDDTGAVIDRVEGGENWSLIGGDNVSKMTPQRGMTGWITGTPTPGKENVAHDASDDTDDDNAEEENDETDDDTNDSNENTVVNSVTSSKRNGTDVHISMKESDAELTLTLRAPETAYVRQPITFTAEGEGLGRNILNSLVYTWNFGDTFTGTGKNQTHAYEYPGEYVVSVNASFKRHTVSVQKTITVLPVSVTIEETGDGDILLTNRAPHTIDISGFVVKGTKTLTLPPQSYISKSGTLTIARSRIFERSTGGMVALYDRSGEMITSIVKNPLLSVRATSPVVSSFLGTEVKAASPVAPSGITPRTKVSSISRSSTSEETFPRATSTVLAGVTIPVYENGYTKPSARSPYESVIPYLGLGIILLLAVVLLYRRPVA